MRAVAAVIDANAGANMADGVVEYMRAGAAVVIEQHNFSPHVLLAEVQRLINDPGQRAKMSVAAKAFARPDAARKIGKILIEIAIEHEPV